MSGSTEKNAVNSLKNKQEKRLVRLNYTLYQIKNYLSNLLLAFIPMGVFYFALALSVYYFVRNAAVSFTSFVSKSIETIQTAAGTTPDALTNFLRQETETLVSTAQTNPSSVSLDYFQEIFARFKQMLNDTYAPFADEILKEGSILINNLFHYFIFAFLILIIGYFFSNIICKIAMHKYGEKNSVLRSLLSVLIESLISTLFLFIGFILAIYTPIGLYGFIIMYLLFYCIFALLIAYWLNGKKQIVLKQVFNVKNILQTILCLVLFLIFPVLIWIGIYYLFGILIAALITIPLLTYTLNCIGCSASNYTIAIREKTLYSEFIKPEIEKIRKKN